MINWYTSPERICVEENIFAVLVIISPKTVHDIVFVKHSSLNPRSSHLSLCLATFLYKVINPLILFSFILKISLGQV